MIRYLFPLICSLIAIFANANEAAKEEFFPSTPEQVASLSCEPSYLIGGIISPFSGQPVLRQTDLIVKGAQNISLNRTYIPPYIPCSFEELKKYQQDFDKYNLYQHLAHHYKGWQFYPHLKLTYTYHRKMVLLTDPSGMSLYFTLSGPDNSVTMLSSSDGISNAIGDSPSGKYDPRNTRIVWQENGKKITVYPPDGSTRIYCSTEVNNRTEQLYLLTKEVLPNGKILRYQYNSNSQPISIESLDPQERCVYASLRIDGSPWEGACHFTSSSGQAVDYLYQKRQFKGKFTKKAKPGEKHYAKGHGKGIKTSFDCISPPILTSVSSPFYRFESLTYSDNFLLDTYLGKNEVFSSSHLGFGSSDQHFKINQLLLPVGQNDAFAPIYTLSYHPPTAGINEGSTIVKNSDGTSTIYHFSKQLLITAIHYLAEDGKVKKIKNFYWNENQWLKSIEIVDAQEVLLYRKSYDYDRFGNPVLEEFTGDLTGNGQLETFVTKRSFSDDGKNLLLQEESDNGKVVCYSYLPSTNLITSKLTKDRNKIILREFSLYDDYHNLIQTVSDDGSEKDIDDLSSVTQRKQINYVLRQTAPFLHMPEWVEETYLEEGVQTLLKKSHFVYDKHGNISEEEVYDSKGNLAYTICKTYNERGDVLSETNRIGQRALYTFDEKGRPASTINFSGRLHTFYQHDTKGRLKKEIQKGDDGITHVISSEYDALDRKILTLDPLQNATRYTYDNLVSKIVQTEYPSILSEDGDEESVHTTATYDSFGRQLSRTDANGNTTNYRYNAYGYPTEITYADESKEKFLYTKEGRLASHIHQDGIIIQYTYDVLGRELSKVYLSSNEDLLAQESFVYSGFQLLSETDKEGNIKKFSYDGAGRKIGEEFCGKTTEFSYDSLGRLSTLSKHNGDNTLIIHYERDIEGRLIEESKTDEKGNLLYRISYSYDEDGNQKTITRYPSGNEAVELSKYDSLGRYIEYVDAYGDSTKTFYDENSVNSLGQRVLQTTVITPSLISYIETKDALGRLVKKETRNSHQKTIASQSFIRDPQGNLLYQIDDVYEGEVFKEQQKIEYTYTPLNQISSMSRACDSSLERTTHYTYLPSGKLATKELPNGVTLFYTYHPLGLLSRLDSSDENICHVFEYDKLGNLILAKDEKSDIEIKRELDAHGNVLKEIFPEELVIEKEYDCFDRTISLKVGDHGSVLYSYDPLHLREVTRKSSDGSFTYSHFYEQYDLDGNLLSESYVGTIGKGIHSVDLKGRKSSIVSPFFSQECSYDLEGNLKKNTLDGVEHLYSYDELSQLSSEKTSSKAESYSYDSLYNRTKRNGASYNNNSLNELIASEKTCCSYDLNGNMVEKKTASDEWKFSYDALNQLIEATSKKDRVCFVYDPLGRRLNKTVYSLEENEWTEIDTEYYLYRGKHEIGAIDKHGKLKNFRIIANCNDGEMPSTVVIELGNEPFAAISDISGNIRKLIRLDTKKSSLKIDYTAFGEETQDHKGSLFNPWRCAGKRLDPELDLLYYGKRYYDPSLARWLTLDPAGVVDGSNLYQYIFNNPFRYRDPDGQFVVALPLLALTWKVIAAAAVTAVVAYELEHQYEHSNSALARSFNSAVQEMVQNIGGVSQHVMNQKSSMKKKQIDANLPCNPDDLLKDPNWKDTSHPDAKEKGHRTFENKESGEKLRYDEGKPGTTGHKAQDHWHRHNPDVTDRVNEYLDANGNPVPRNSPESHLYPVD